MKEDLRICVFQVIPFLFYPIEDIRGKMILIFTISIYQLLEILVLTIITLLLVYISSVYIKELKTSLLLLLLLYLNYSISAFHNNINNASFSICYVVISILLLYYYSNQIGKIIEELDVM